MVKKKKGFTLVEMIASIAMLVIIFGVVASLLLLAVRRNMTNERDLTSNIASKAFIELVNSEKTNNILGANSEDNNVLKNMTGSVYIFRFTDVGDELKTIFNDFLNNPGNYKTADDFDSGSISNPTNKKYAVKIRITKDDTIYTYKIEVNSWNLRNVQTSKIYRVIYINKLTK